LWLIPVVVVVVVENCSGHGTGRDTGGNDVISSNTVLCCFLWLT